MSEREQAARKAYEEAYESAWKALKERITRFLEAYVDVAATAGEGFDVR
jgi:hypothetical protein